MINIRQSKEIEVKVLKGHGSFNISIKLNVDVEYFPRNLEMQLEYSLDLYRAVYFSYVHIILMYDHPNQC